MHPHPFLFPPAQSAGRARVPPRLCGPGQIKNPDIEKVVLFSAYPLPLPGVGTAVPENNKPGRASFKEESAPAFMLSSISHSDHIP